VRGESAHRIGKLLIEADISETHLSAGFRQRIETVAAARLPAAIERALDGADDGMQISAERLDLDIGTIPADGFEEAFVAACERALEEALSKLLSGAASDGPGIRAITPGRARLDRFEAFLRSGVAPRGFDAGETLATLIAEDPSDLAAMLRSRAREAHFLERLVLQIGGDGLRSLLAMLAPADAAIILAIIADMLIAHRHEPLRARVRLAEPALERLLWITTLEFLLIDAGTQFNRRRYLERLLRREAERSGIAYSDLLEMLGRSVAQVRRKTGFRSSLPVVLAALLAEQGLEGGEVSAERPLKRGARDLTTAIAAAARGDFLDLLQLLERHAGDRVWLLALVRALAPALFEGLVRELEAANADTILALLEDLDRSAVENPLPAQSPDEVALRLRATTLHFLVRDAGSQFNRRRFLERLLRREAADIGADYTDLLGLLTAALAKTTERRGLRSSLPAVLADLLAEAEDKARPETKETSGDDAAPERRRTRPGGPARQPGELPALFERLPPAERNLLIEELAGSHAAKLRSLLGLLAQAHAVRPLLALPGAAFGELVWSLAAAHLMRRPEQSFDVTALIRDIISGIAEAAGVDSGDVAAAIHFAARSFAEGDTLTEAVEAAGFADPRREVEAFLRSGGDGRAARHLEALAQGDSAWLAELVRSIVRDDPAAAPLLSRRLTEWLVPEEIAALFAPETGKTIIASLDSGARRDSWRAAVEAALAGREPELEAGDATGRRIDAIEAIRGWLRAGGRAGGIDEAELDWAVAELGLSEWTAILLAESSERTASRVRLLVEHLGGTQRKALLATVAPWAVQPSGPLAALLARAEGRQKLDLLARAAASTLEGGAIDMTALGLPVEPDAAAESAPGPPPGPDEFERLIAWLDGGSASASQAAALLDAFNRLAASRDDRLVGYLRSGLGNREARGRWASLLPPEGAARLALLVAPPGARAHVEAALLVASAARRASRFGAQAADPALLWATLFDIIAEPALAALPRALERLVAAAAPGQSAAREDLLVHARKLAGAGGNVPVAAALKRVAAPRSAQARPKPQIRDRSPDERKKTEPEPESAIYIGNAGLVLIGPYLPALFERLGVLGTTEDGKSRILGLEAASRAVHLLQYLIDGRLDAPEHELVLNKLLCGLATALPVEPRIEATKADLELCDGLLAGVIANWTIIENTSVAGLRETFLQREGRLVHREGQWDLTVQRRTLDVLVDRIPWSFSIVYHRWMAEPIHTAW
jgi:hypothetical protein